MTKRFHCFVIIAVVLLAPSLIFATANEFRVAKAVNGGENIVTVPLEITNEVDLAALDIPLRFSEGVELLRVEFEDTRVSYFDIKLANINNDENTVVIGLLPQISAAYKPNLEPGTGVIARLVFEVMDDQAQEITLEAVRLENPFHTLAFISVNNDKEGKQRIVTIEPQFEDVVVALGAAGAVPSSFALQQNYPNPFNPTTQISFDLPQASRVELSVYNVLGQKVETLIDGAMDAGTHQIEWNGDGNSSGIYFYRLQADNFSATKKMMMLK